MLTSAPAGRLCTTSRPSGMPSSTGPTASGWPATTVSGLSKRRNSGCTMRERVAAGIELGLERRRAELAVVGPHGRAGRHGGHGDAREDGLQRELERLPLAAARDHEAQALLGEVRRRHGELARARRAARTRPAARPPCGRPPRASRRRRRCRKPRGPAAARARRRMRWPDRLPTTTGCLAGAKPSASTRRS